MVSTSDYEFPPNPWKLFTAVGNPTLTLPYPALTLPYPTLTLP